jgi:hypothetical protein
MKTPSKRHDVGPSFAAELAGQFNRELAVGAKIWFWRTLPFGPVLETTIRGAAFVSDAQVPVAFIAGVAGYVSIFHITPPLEAQRPFVNFANIAESETRHGDRVTR